MKARFPLGIAITLSIIAAASLGACGSDGDPPPGSGICGNGIVDTSAGEVCDGMNLNGVTCMSGTMGVMSAGTPGCSADCKTFTMGTCTGGGQGGATGSGGGPGTGTGGGP